MKNRRNIIDYFQKSWGCNLTNPSRINKKSNISNSFIIKKVCALEKESQKYPLTLTLNRKLPFLRGLDDSETHAYVEERLRRNPKWKKINYILFPEYDDGGKLHYHGVSWGCYQSVMGDAMSFWRKNFGFVDKGWSKTIKFYKCENYSFEKSKNWIEDCKYIIDKMIRNGCWSHYMTKSYKKTGLKTLYNY